MEVNSNLPFLFYSFISLFLLIATIRTEACPMFVFGDSYADTGNLGKLGPRLTRCWYEPYGITYPHHPTGRFSDGKILPDFIASFMEIKSPIPYKLRKTVNSSLFSNGMNFAVAGSGVFDLGNFQRNLSLQIDTFKSQVSAKAFKEVDFSTSVAFVAISGNDYSKFFERGGKERNLLGFIKKVNKQLEIDLKRIKDLGVGTVVVTNLAPLGCIPVIARANNYECNAKRNAQVVDHNKNLVKIVEHLNKGSDKASFLVLDLYSAFMSIINQERGAMKFKGIFRPCCEGKTAGSNCGEIDGMGVKMYTVCPNPGEYLYWDSVHPTQAGWDAVFQLIKPWLTQNLS